MCGIAGFIVRSKERANAERLTPMLDSVSHRGPDDSGQIVLGSLALGHRRLSILDTSPAGHQPMEGHGRSSWIVYNGEIYNHEAIRRSLSLGTPYRGTSDTETLLQALDETGLSVLQKLNGIFAFAYFDFKQNQLILVRDQFGVKPLYFAQDKDRFYFGSEIKAILAGGYQASLEPLAVMDFTFTGWTADERTFFSGVHRLPPASLLKYDLSKGTWQLERWARLTPAWLNYSGLGDNASKWEAATAAALELAVERQLMSDVPVGAFCSGGVDSSLVSAIAARKKSDIVLFNVSCPDAPTVDEGPWANIVAKHLKIPLHTFTLNKMNFRQSLVRTVYVTEYPLAFLNTVPMYLVSQLAHDAGIKVLLSGEGADECFGGYVGKYKALAIQHVLRSKGVLTRNAANFILKKFNRLSEKLGRSEMPQRGAMHQVLTGGGRSSALWEASWKEYDQFQDPLDRELACTLLDQLQSYLLPILHRTDRASMAASVEARVPFLDSDLVGLVLAMPPRFKIGSNGFRPVGKAILKKIASSYLPQSVVYRTKMGFSVPQEYYVGSWPNSWLKDGFVREAFGVGQESLQHWIAGEKSQSAGWMLTLEIWGQLFIRGRSIEDVEHEFAQ